MFDEPTFWIGVLLGVVAGMLFVTAAGWHIGLFAPTTLRVVKGKSIPDGDIVRLGSASCEMPQWVAHIERRVEALEKAPPAVTPQGMTRQIMRQIKDCRNETKVKRGKKK